MLMSEADMGGANNSAIDTATVSTIEGGSVSVGNETAEGGDEAGGVLVKRGGTAGTPCCQYTLFILSCNTPYHHINTL